MLAWLTELPLRHPLKRVLLSLVSLLALALLKGMTFRLSRPSCRMTLVPESLSKLSPPMKMNAGIRQKLSRP